MFRFALSDWTPLFFTRNFSFILYSPLFFFSRFNQVSKIGQVSRSRRRIDGRLLTTSLFCLFFFEILTRFPSSSLISRTRDDIKFESFMYKSSEVFIHRSDLVLFSFTGPNSTLNRVLHLSLLFFFYLVDVLDVVDTARVADRHQRRHRHQNSRFPHLPPYINR